MFRSQINTIFISLCVVSTALALLLLGGIVLLLFSESWNALAKIGIEKFFFDESWFPQASGEGTFGILPMLGSSLALAICSALLAVPIALAAVIYRRFYANKLSATSIRTLIEVLNGVPSVVFGLLGLTILVPLINLFHPPGSSFLVGTFVLALMILPTAAMFFDAGFEKFTDDIYFNSAALDLPRVKLICSILIPASLPSIAAGTILSLARALGETMAVLMVTGNIIQFPKSVFDPIRTLTANIALEMPYALDLHRSALFVCGFTLVTITMISIVTSKLLFTNTVEAR